MPSDSSPSADVVDPADGVERIDLTLMDEPVARGGALVRPGDVVGCDGDGAVVVPMEVAGDVVTIAKGIPFDETVNVEAMERFFA